MQRFLCSLSSTQKEFINVDTSMRSAGGRLISYFSLPALPYKLRVCIEDGRHGLLTCLTLVNGDGHVGANLIILFYYWLENL